MTKSESLLLPFKYKIPFPSDLRHDPDTYRATFGDLTIIAVNTNHTFYDRYMRPKIEDRNEGNDIVPIHLLIGAMVHAEQDDYDNADYDTFRDRKGLILKQHMQKYDLD